MGIFENTPQEKIGRANSTTLQRIIQTPSKFVNNRAQATAQRKLQEKINSTIQRQVPRGGETSKPVANPGSYRPRGGQNTIFDKDDVKRKELSFGSKTREEVFSRYNPQRVGNRIISIRASHGGQENVEGIQLDHQTSWDTISEVMTQHNRALKLRNEKDSSKYYTLYDAKLYYNDQDNLVPALGAINASGGASGVSQIERIHYGLEIAQGSIQTSWQNLQAGLVAVGVGVSEEAAERIATLLLGVAREMNIITDRLL